MNEIKVNLTISLPGRKMLSEQECSKKLKKPVLFAKGKYAGKQVLDKQRKPVYKTVVVPDPEKCTKHFIKIRDENNNVQTLSVYTRGYESITQNINISQEAYKDMISSNIPNNYRDKKWKNLSKEDRLLWHLEQIASQLGGDVLSYQVFDE